MHSGEKLPVISVGASFRDAVIEITNKGLGCVCVVEEGNYLAGILTDGDVRRFLHRYEDLRGLHVRDMMTASPITIKEEAFLSEALALMENRQSQISVIPVVDDKEVCIGIIRVHDIIRSGL
jgi:arabinose-5-phosphate isomerase